MFYALAIAFDPAKRRCDLVFAAGRLVIDRTPATPLLLAIGTDGRAEPDDDLPDGATEGSIQAAFNRRRGYTGDRLDPTGGGQRLGSRLWLQERDKLGDDTLLDAEDYARQATASFLDRYGVEIEVAASRDGRDTMLLQVQAGLQTLTVRRTLA